MKVARMVDGTERSVLQTVGATMKGGGFKNRRVLQTVGATMEGGGFKKRRVVQTVGDTMEGGGFTLKDAERLCKSKTEYYVPDALATRTVKET